MQQLLGQLLVPGDPPPFSVHNAQGKAPLLLLCDHASKAIPKALGDLGISDEELSRHIGWDIGGLDAAIELSQALDAPLLASGYSRLVIDCNRWPGGEGSTPEISDGTPVPANRGLTKEQVDARAERSDDDGHLVFHAKVEIELQPVVRFMHDLIDGIRRRRPFGMLRVVFGKLVANALQPIFEHWPRPRVK